METSPKKQLKRSTREVLRDALNQSAKPSAELIALGNENGFVWSGSEFVDLEAPQLEPTCTRCGYVVAVAVARSPVGFVCDDCLEEARKAVTE